MSSIRLPFSPVSVCIGITLSLVLSYGALMAVVMSYAALTVEFAQEVRNTEASVAALEAEYLQSVKLINQSDFTRMGYAKPLSQTFVAQASVTALR